MAFPITAISRDYGDSDDLNPTRLSYCDKISSGLSFAAGSRCMELALNLVWLVLASGLLLHWGAHALSFSEKHRVAAAAIALTCVICLLFPVISITDDLNSGAAVFEARTLIKKWCVSLDVAGALLTAVTAVSSVRLAAWRDVNLHADVFHQLHELYASNLGRRPPPSLL